MLVYRVTAFCRLTNLIAERRTRLGVSEVSGRFSLDGSIRCLLSLKLALSDFIA